MTDGRNRDVSYLRLSVTDRCNLRCTYCMPAEGVPALAHSDMLSYEELLRLARLFARLGTRRVRLTGGEPLVRKNLERLVAGLKEAPGIEWVGLTTNGVLLKEQLPALLSAGLDGVNLSLDTLDRAQYRVITRRDALHQVLEGLEAARSCSGLRVKLNCVPTGVNRKQGGDGTSPVHWQGPFDGKGAFRGVRRLSVSAGAAAADAGPVSPGPGDHGAVDSDLPGPGFGYGRPVCDQYCGGLQLYGGDLPPGGPVS
ncbi:radical SAM protein [Pseudoflavonifractor sp. 60]|uniref:GTP 3',8-cyclase MoaA n=1 Tax=Pseudoflavonifractor sp. 60 TaxID=2304576 RepID=UPI0013718841|nr:radical SAM protein [Pseudoflavonifractor sp. 60]MCI8914760.1 radical SAM protein [Lawsonibacter sp.]